MDGCSQAVSWAFCSLGNLSGAGFGVNCVQSGHSQLLHQRGHAFVVTRGCGLHLCVCLQLDLD